MSLVSTFIKAVDGKYYKNPTYRRDDWFICFDDDEPIELVVKAEANLKPEDILAQLEGFPDHKIKKNSSGSSRIFNGVFAHAISYWIFPRHDSFFKPFPVPNVYDAIYSQFPEYEGVFFGISPNEI